MDIGELQELVISINNRNNKEIRDHNATKKLLSKTRPIIESLIEENKKLKELQ